MSEERLEGIEVQGYENDGEHKLFVLLKECDYLYLREQAGRKQELERDYYILGYEDMEEINNEKETLRERVQELEGKVEELTGLYNSKNSDYLKEKAMREQSWKQNKRYRQTMFFLELKLLDFKEYANKIEKMSDEKMIKDYADRFMGDISETLQALEDEE